MKVWSLPEMSVEPRTTQRRALEPHRPVGVEQPVVRSTRTGGLESSAEEPRPAGRHIPLFVLRQEGSEPAQDAMGAHRFRSRPTPVLGASVSLFGLASVDRAARPWRADRGGYQVRAVHPDGVRMQGPRLASRRFPKV